MTDRLPTMTNRRRWTWGLAAGAGIELLTAPKAVDPLSTQYSDLIRAGAGPAFVSFHARDTASLHTALRSGGYPFQESGGITDFQASDLAFLFFIR